MSLFTRFISAHACNTLSAGIQIILVAWLAVAVLRLSAVDVGWVQSAMLVPNVLLLLWVGAIVDRTNPAKVLTLANGALVATHGVFLAVYVGVGLSLQALLAYAVALGVLSALIQNAREALVGRVGEGSALQKTVSTVTFVQFSAQAFGVGLASLTDWLGVPALLLLQAFLCLMSFGFYWGLSKGISAVDVVNGSLFAGVKTLWRVKNLRLMLGLVAFNGLMHLGMFVVVLPLVATHHFGFDALAYGALQLCFIAGSIVVSVKLMFADAVNKPGQHVVFALLYSGLIGFALSAGPTPFGLYALVFCWGAVAGSSANHSRVIVQSLSPEGMRGRTMGLYQFALFGAAPIGAVLAGYLVHVGGINLPLKTLGTCSILVFVLLFFSKSLWLYEPEGEN